MRRIVHERTCPSVRLSLLGTVCDGAESSCGFQMRFSRARWFLPAERNAVGVETGRDAAGAVMDVAEERIMRALLPKATA
jgi:hypothetical protein